MRTPLARVRATARVPNKMRLRRHFSVLIECDHCDGAGSVIRGAKEPAGGIDADVTRSVASGRRRRAPLPMTVRYSIRRYVASSELAYRINHG